MHPLDALRAYPRQAITGAFLGIGLVIFARPICIAIVAVAEALR